MYMYIHTSYIIHFNINLFFPPTYFGERALASVNCSLVPDSCDPMDLTHQALLFMELSKQEYWRELHFLLEGIFLPQGLNSGLLHCRQILYHLSHQVNYIHLIYIIFHSIWYICNFLYVYMNISHTYVIYMWYMYIIICVYNKIYSVYI